MTRKLRITVINDYPAFLEMIDEALSSEGYEVQTIPKHQGAFEQLKEWGPDLIVLDLVLGNAPAGWGLLDQIKFDQATEQIPVLLCSAATKEIREVVPSLTAKGVDYLEKPFDLDTFLAKLTKLIASAKPATASNKAGRS
jgi:DNA-binding response OmpR family regulator